MKKKLILLIVLLLFTIPVCMYISSLIHLMFSGEFSDLTLPNFNDITTSIFSNPNHFKVYGLLQYFFTLFSFYAIFMQKSNPYEIKMVNVTNKIKTPAPAGEGQYGTASWITKSEFDTKFPSNILDNSIDIKEQNFEGGGLVVGYKKLNHKKEKIYYINENTHSLTVGATRSGKTRTIVLETVGNLGLAGESMIISDPKSEIYHYTSEYLTSLGYEVFTIDFNNPAKSSRYNFLQPIIDKVKKNEMQEAEEYAWHITESLVGDGNPKGEAIWRNGEMSIIAGTIMSVVCDNMDHPEYQNLTNVYTFIAEMCQTENGTMPINEYLKNLDKSKPASMVFKVATIAPERTRNSFFTAALATLRLFTSESIYSMTCSSDFLLKDTGGRKRVIYIILPDEKTTYNSLATLFVNQQYQILAEIAKAEGGALKNRTNFVLDEFGNFTHIKGFDQMLTVGGSRNMRFNIFLQSFSQLDYRYTKEIASNILDNCRTWIYLKTANTETATKIMKKLR